MGVFLHSSLGSSLCGQSDNLVRSAGKITQAYKEQYLYTQKIRAEKKKRNLRIGRNVKCKASMIGTHMHIIQRLYPSGSKWAVGVSKSIWLAFKDPWLSSLFIQMRATISQSLHHFVLITMMKNTCFVSLWAVYKIKKHVRLGPNTLNIFILVLKHQSCLLLYPHKVTISDGHKTNQLKHIFRHLHLKCQQICVRVIICSH